MPSTAKFQSRGIKLAAGISTLAVSVFYLIPQMVGAGVLVQPLFGLPHWAGVLLVGAVVILIVVTAGMVTTTYVQFLKGSLLVVFSTVLTVMILNRGLHRRMAVAARFHDSHYPDTLILPETCRTFSHPSTSSRSLLSTGMVVPRDADRHHGRRPTLVNGLPQGRTASRPAPSAVSQLPGGADADRPAGTAGVLPHAAAERSRPVGSSEDDQDGRRHHDVVYSPKPTPGSEVLRPGKHPAFKGIRSDKLTDKLNFLSLMLALFCGTASLPHILIRYYTVKDQAAARKSTVVGIASIGFFYMLTLYMGLGAMTSGALDVTNSNMAAPLLARSFSELLFAIISAIAFTTVLGTVSGLIVAASGAVVHDLLASVLQRGN